MPLSSKDENAVSFDTANYNYSSAQPQPQLLATQPWYIRPRWSLSSCYLGLQVLSGYFPSIFNLFGLSDWQKRTSLRST